MSDVTAARAIAERFAAGGAVADVAPFAGGHINESYLVTLRRRGSDARVLLQRINDAVFPAPLLVMENVERVTRHIAASSAREGSTDAARRALVLLTTASGATFVLDEAGGVWRAFRYIDGARSLESAATPHEAYAAAAAFGHFQRQLADLPGPRLHDTIAGFHDTPRRLAAFERAVERDAANRAARAAPEIAVIVERRVLGEALVAAHRRGELPERVVHNDAKLSNVLLDAATGEALCVVDLDTVMPGLSLYDFGDLARSMASSSAEDERDLARVEARPAFVEALMRGYLDGTGPLLSIAERALLVTAAKVITLEQAARFLADHLDSDRYYRVAWPDQNLDRARAQLALLRSFERQEERFEEMCARLTVNG